MTGQAPTQRKTPLATRLEDQIRREGPITVRAFMDACLHDPEHGYYRNKNAIGAAGDFITAPEISQVFGELLGLWSAVVWQSSGAPSRVNLVEIGPGRGTLMADAVRATRIVPGFHAATSVHLVETSEPLRAEQRARLAGAGVPVRWHTSLDALAQSLTDDEAATIIMANEFLDTCAASQYVMGSHGLMERGVGLDERGAFAFVEIPTEVVAAIDLKAGDVFERQDFGFVAALARLAERRPLAALFVDYGHVKSAPGDTLQAVRAHQAEHPLVSPGEADLTVHVDFAAFRAAVELAGLEVDGPITQAELLGSLGIIERASRLMSLNPSRAGTIETAVARLMAPGGMGSRFKAIAVRAGVAGPLPGF